MFRIGLAIMIGGGFLIWYGCREYNVSRGTTTEPAAVEMGHIESGLPVGNNHIRVGEHVRMYTDLIYEYETGRYESSKPKMSSKVNHAYYPIISAGHPYLKSLDELKKKYKGLGNVPEGEFPELTSISCLVKTERFGTIGQLPEGMESAPSVQGLVINRIEELDDEEKRLVGQSFPSVDLNKVLILEEGRTPSSVSLSFGAMIGGLVLIFAPILMWFRGRSGGGGGEQEA